MDEDDDTGVSQWTSELEREDMIPHHQRRPLASYKGTSICIERNAKFFFMVQKNGKIHHIMQQLMLF